MPREHPKTDRVACPWLISRYINNDPESLFVVPDPVLIAAKATDAVSYDIPVVTLTHSGETCSVDTRARYVRACLSDRLWCEAGRHAWNVDLVFPLFPTVTLLSKAFIDLSNLRDRSGFQFS